MAGDKLLQVENLTKYFYKPQGLFGEKKQTVKSVDHISFDIMRNETLGLVGESGCGKTTVGRTITRLYEPTDGRIIFDGKDISHLTKKELLPYRKKMQMIFQDPYASLNARMTVMDIIREALCDVTRSVSKMTEIERRGGKRWDKPKKAEKSRDCGGGKF